MAASVFLFDLVYHCLQPFVKIRDLFPPTWILHVLILRLVVLYRLAEKLESRLDLLFPSVDEVLGLGLEELGGLHDIFIHLLDFCE